MEMYGIKEHDQDDFERDTSGVDGIANLPSKGINASYNQYSNMQLKKEMTPQPQQHDMPSMNQIDMTPQEDMYLDISKRILDRKPVKHQMASSHKKKA